jgi:hypothetical protein
MPLCLVIYYVEVAIFGWRLGENGGRNVLSDGIEEGLHYPARNAIRRLSPPMRKPRRLIPPFRPLVK